MNNVFSLDSYVRAINKVSKLGKTPVGVIINEKLRPSLTVYFQMGESREIKANKPEKGQEYDPIFGGDLIIYGLPVYFDSELKKDFEVYYNNKVFERVVWANYIRDSLKAGVTIEEIRDIYD